MKIAILGIQGSGKSTQATCISQRFDIPIISLGGILRTGIESNDPFVTNLYPRSELDAGHLAPDSLVKAVLTRELSRLPDFVLEGFPRTADQADFLIRTVNLDLVIEIILPEDVVVNRLSNRGRSDDTELGIRRRISSYYNNCFEIRDQFQKIGILRTIDGESSISTITERIVSLVDHRRL